MGNLAWVGARGTNIPRALPLFPLPSPTAKKPLRSKQHERGLCGGESDRSVKPWWYWLKDSCKVCHQSLVSFDPSFVSQIGRFEVRLLLVVYKTRTENDIRIPDRIDKTRTGSDRINRAIGRLSHDGIGWKTHVKFVISHWSVSIRLLLVKLVGLRSVYC